MQSSAGAHSEEKESVSDDSSTEYWEGKAETSKKQAEDDENRAKAKDGASMADLEMKKPAKQMATKLASTHRNEKEQETLEELEKDSVTKTSNENGNVDDDLDTGMFTTTTYILAAICVLALLAIAWILLRLKEMGAFAPIRER